MGKRKRPKFRQALELRAFLCGLALVPRLPRCCAVALARAAGRVSYTFSHRNRRIGRANLDLVYGDGLTPRQKKRLLIRSLQSFSLLTIDLLWFARHTRQRLERWVQWDPSSRVMFDPGPALMLTAHYGNWETLGQAYAAKGAPILSVAAPLKNPGVDAHFIRIRQLTGQVIIPQKGAARRLLQGLKESAKLAVLLDQNIRPRDGGVFVDFFDLPVPVSAVPASLAVKTGCDVVFVTSAADRCGRYTVKVHEVLRATPGAEDPVKDLTQRMTRAVETLLRREPEYWCWSYRRWRFPPPDQPVDARYPFYARELNPNERGREAAT